MKLIPLNKGLFAKVSDHRYENLMQWKWHAEFNQIGLAYAVRNVKVSSKNKRIRMHRQIMETPAGMECDHINHDTLDNQDENLRNCTGSENSRNRKKPKNNTSGYKGVIKTRNKWTAILRTNLGGVPVVIFRKAFYTPEEAADAYDSAVKKHFGEFGFTNK
jgi:hypothetical protein